MFASKCVKLMFCLSLLLVAFGFVRLAKGHATDLEARPFNAADVLGGLKDTPLSMAIATGDFDRDGFRDVAVVTRDFSGVLVYLNNQDGTFADPLVVTNGVGNAPVGIATGDFNNDDIKDLVVANSGDGTLSILLGNGDGNFRSAGTLTVGNTPTGVAVEDFNEDNNEDIAVANSGDNNVSVMLGNGNGTFRPRTNYMVGSNPVAVVVEDFNNDEVLDLAVANAGSGTISVLLGELAGAVPTGTFRPAIHTPTVSGVAVMVAEEFRGNDVEDLVVANPASNTVSVLFGNRNGTFRPGPTLPVGDGPVAIEAEALRVGSTAKDIIVASVDSGTVTVFLGTGTGQFGSPTAYSVPNVSAIAGHNFHAPAPGDGITDIVVVTSDFVVQTLYGNGDGTLTNPFSP